MGFPGTGNRDYEIASRLHVLTPTRIKLILPPRLIDPVSIGTEKRVVKTTGETWGVNFQYPMSQWFHSSSSSKSINLEVNDNRQYTSPEYRIVAWPYANEFRPPIVSAKVI
jgi:hypothetical protein